MPTPTLRSRIAPWWREHHRSAAWLWGAFAAVHLLLCLLSLYAPGLPMGDVSIVYKEWVRQAVAGEGVVGIDSTWVYPIVAFLPMAAAWMFGPDLYDVTWLGLVVAADAVAFGLLIGWNAGKRATAAWWWLAFLFLLGPIAVGRIDAFTMPLAIIGLVWASRRPAVAAVLLTIGTWIKVWPAALLGAAIIALRARWRMLQVALASSAAIIAIALVLGSGTRIFSFFSDQTTRGLQVESSISTIWVWLSAFGVPDTYVFYNEPLNTFEVHGFGTDLAAALMNPLLGLSVLAIVLLGIRAMRAGADAGRLLPVLALAFTIALIAFNKVLSPQYIVWLAAPVVAGIVVAGRQFSTPAKLSLWIAALTQLIYPYLYILLLSVNPLMVTVLTARNVLLFVALGWLVRELARMAGAPVLVRPGASKHAPISAGP
ncbi:DUF2029 domain-containing protein [Microbacteriaceae bacterium VKM Ac-2855]|nr:DUF2029 domain-containing protein [Microbacteriaceae bacterium VKM Ac-2855]